MPNLENLISPSLKRNTRRKIKMIEIFVKKTTTNFYKNQQQAIFELFLKHSEMRNGRKY